MANVFGIDMGTLNLKVYSSQTNEVYKIKNTIAIKGKDEMYAFGDDAYDMYEKSPANIQVSFPVVTGVIADYKNMQTMIFEFLNDIAKNAVRGAEFVVAVPTDITQVEKKAFYDMFAKSKAKSRQVRLCDKPVADAVGLGIDIVKPTGVMVVDFGANTTEISVMSLGGLVTSELLHFGSTKLDDSIISYLRKQNGLIIGRKTAMLLKESIGNAIEEEEPVSKKIVGMNIVSGLPVETEITSSMIYKAIKDNLESICASIKRILEKTPPEVAKDIVSSGIYITGGGSKLMGLDRLFSKITNIKVNTSEDPDESAVRGLSRIMTDSNYQNLLLSTMNERVLK